MLEEGKNYKITTGHSMGVEDVSRGLEAKYGVRSVLYKRRSESCVLCMNEHPRD